MRSSAETRQINLSQCCVARVLLSWLTRKFAEMASFPAIGIVELECGTEVVSAEDVANARFAPEGAGVKLIEDTGGPCARLKALKPGAIGAENWNRSSGERVWFESR